MDLKFCLFVDHVIWILILLYIGSPGPWILKFCVAVGSSGSWILEVCFAVGSRGSCLPVSVHGRALHGVGMDRIAWIWIWSGFRVDMDIFS